MYGTVGVRGRWCEGLYSPYNWVESTDGSASAPATTVIGAHDGVVSVTEPSHRTR